MTNIPFPNPHESDALNAYLDDLAAGKQAIPESEVETAAQAFHQLASRAEVKPPTQQSVESVRGEETMQTATLAALISNRTRRQMAMEKKPDKSYGWLSAVIVAGLIISMIGTAWLNREPGNPNENLAWAPGTATVIAEDGAWVQNFDPADCSETSGLHQVEINYQAMSNGEPQSYGIVGPANSSDAEAATRQYRAMRSCETLTDAWAYWTDARINEHTREISDQNLTELAELQTHFAAKYPDQFIVIMNDLTISPEIEAEWEARKNMGFNWQPIPLEAKINPDFAVELSDGRIAFPATVVYSFDDPAIQAYGFPVENPPSTVVMIFAMEDGVWKYDDSLALCLVNCENGVGNPLDPAEAEWAQSPETQTCTRQPLLPELNYTNDLTTIPYENRSYTPAEPASPELSAEIAESVVAWNTCGYQGDDAASTYLTPLGTMNMAVLESGSAGDPIEAAPYLRQWDEGSRQLVSQTSAWNQLVVMDEPIRNTTFGMQWTPMFSGSAPNNASVRVTSQGFNPATAIELEDGRVSIFSVPTIALEDRGAVTYEGNHMHQQVAGVTLQQHGDVWLIDEPVLVDSGTLLSKGSDGWWWDSAFDEPDVPWTYPISSEECPVEEIEGSVLNNAPSGLLYSQEDYDAISTDRSYEVEGLANASDASAIVTRARESYACGMQSETLPFWTTRFEYENRTRVGQASLSSAMDQRIDDAAAIMRWYESELGLTESDLIVRVDPSEFSLDETERSFHIGPFNPGYAVQLSDGRIAIIHTVIVYGDTEYEPSIHQGLNVTIFAPEDGKWMVDEIVPVRFSDDQDLPWTQPVSFNECPDDAMPHGYELNNPGSTMYTQEDYDQVSSERSYEIVGPADPGDADDVETRMRETQACIYEGKSTLKWTARFEYETRTTDGRADVEETAEERSEGAESISAWLESNFGYSIHDLIVYQDPDDLTLDGTESVVDTGLGNPDLVVEFSDGRVGIIMSLVTYEPFPDEWDFDSLPGFEAIMIIFVYQDGEWMLDENLPMCIGDCSELPMATPMSGFDPYATPDATPVE